MIPPHSELCVNNFLNKASGTVQHFTQGAGVQMWSLADDVVVPPTKELVILVLILNYLIHSFC